ncbi:uncharacterized protein LACBIDRAFT_308981 [Laccaria bicolor S238N-H82]|uniref:Predicted protein n=1 Tax=Laccaria bicolor (strain S238N-H82 / ATCC MYA-4686) TaxID=486041 RepID=B0CV88_LACBS|nr:uncharacterized protein LACBIDRAFT_308981 [Laccaria bicolor S238N-H82]EDR13288.1 predicted protein [Laccaria bicolor S238N-H82]|eukprot:XP_001875786.1 predicted protein [Laccaria bicolor S238N-H82]
MDSQSPSLALADPSSLRAAALLTLKAKRRKPALEQSSSFSRPLPASDAFQLDYGQGDAPDHSMDTSKPSNITANSPPVSPAQPPDTKNRDLQMREEGEISDEEETSLPSLAPNPSPTQGKPSPSPVYSKNVDVSFLTSPRRVPAAELPRLPLADRTPNFSPVSRASHDNQPAPSKPLLQGVNHVDNSSVLVSADQVRPGLPLTQSEYDTAKDIVLDILGWGVPPEYLVDCGLTREIIYYVFTELNLRLPQNLDITGLIPYTPDAVLAFRRPTLMPPPPLPEAIRRSVSGSSLASSSTLTDPRQKRRTPPMAVLSPPSSAGSPTAGDLHDMERQRRQELMARKAVQASRKLKQLAYTDATSVITTGAINQDVEMMSAVPTESVDDFLNSIGPIPSTGSTPGPAEQVEAAEMDVDDIPGLGIAPRDGPRTQSSAVPSEFIPKFPMELGATRAPSSDLVATFGSGLSMTDVGPSEPSTPDVHGFQRRGAKRPVAADFVDFDSAPRSNGSGNGHEHANGYPLTRRRTGGANFTNLRPGKCVIDLSDSEGEDAGGDVHRGPMKRKYSLAASPGPTRPPSGNMSPAVLMEKELEILRMKQLIAEREQSRFKKLAISRSMSNLDTSESLAPIKQEEDESSVLFRFGEDSINNVSDHSSHSTTPRECRDPRLVIRGIHISLRTVHSIRRAHSVIRCAGP